MNRINGVLAATLLAASNAVLAGGIADYRAGVAAEDQGDYGGAIHLFDSALRGKLKDEDREAAYYNRGVAHHRKGQYDLAIADYTSALKLNPSDAKAHNNRGVAYKNQRRFDLALADYNAAIELDPDNASAHFNRANAYAQRGQNEQAIADYNDAIRLHPGDGPHAPSYFDETAFKRPGAGSVSAHAAAAASESAQYILIWRYLAERRAGGDGKAELTTAAAKLSSRAWPYPVIAFFLGKLSRDELLAAAGDSAASNNIHRCEVAAFLGEDDLLRGNTDSALHLFAQARETCTNDSAERRMVFAEQERVAPHQ
jgi:lipoprotein NlpI